MGTTKGVNYTNQTAAPIVKVSAGNVNSKMRAVKDKFTTTLVTSVTSGDEINFPFLPEGAVILDAKLISDSDMGASGSVSLGLRAHVDEDGTTVAEDDNSLVLVTSGIGAAFFGRMAATCAGLGIRVGKGGAQVFATLQSNVSNAGVVVTAIVEYIVE